MPPNMITDDVAPQHATLYELPGGMDRRNEHESVFGCARSQA